MGKVEAKREGRESLCAWNAKAKRAAAGYGCSDEEAEAEGENRKAVQDSCSMIERRILSSEGPCGYGGEQQSDDKKRASSMRYPGPPRWAKRSDTCQPHSAHKAVETAVRRVVHALHEQGPAFIVG